MSATGDPSRHRMLLARLIRTLPSFALLAFAVAGQAADWRRFSEGRLIPDESYCDQPYVVITKDGNWLCTMTTGPGGESQPGQHVVARISRDQGRTWSPSIDIEPSGAIESSWVVPAVTPGGRVYAFYNYNGDDVRSIPGKTLTHATLLGWYVYRYSDDHGRTWSAQRHRLPLPVAELDRGNEWGGRVQMFWGVDKPTAFDGALVFAFTRLGRYEPRYPRAPAERPANDEWRRLAPTENGSGWVYRSDNIFTERDPARIEWKLLPEDGRGIRSAALDPLQQEHNLAVLPDGGLACILRTVHGYVAAAYSRDGGKSWTEPAPATYADGGHALKNSIACAAVWRTTDGKYLLWYHNNDDMQRGAGPPVTSRNAAWLAAGAVKDGRLVWSQPELVCYNAEPNRGSSYPDLIEDDGRFFISATNKREARVAAIDPALLDGLFRQESLREVASQGLVLAAVGATEMARPRPMPRLPNLAGGGGFSIEVAFTAASRRAGQVLVDSRDEKGAGVRLVTGGQGEVQLELSDGKNTFAWASDAGLLRAGARHHVVFSVDGGPKLVSVVVDGRLGDGGTARAFGYGRFVAPAKAGPDAALGDVSGGASLRVAPAFDGEIAVLRIYDRALRTSEAIGNFRATRAAR